MLHPHVTTTSNGPRRSCGLCGILIRFLLLPEFGAVQAHGHTQMMCQLARIEQQHATQHQSGIRINNFERCCLIEQYIEINHTQQRNDPQCRYLSHCLFPCLPSARQELISLGLDPSSDNRTRKEYCHCRRSMLGALYSNPLVLS